jgi:hypothetical protein
LLDEGIIIAASGFDQINLVAYSFQLRFLYTSFAGVAYPERRRMSMPSKPSVSQELEVFLRIIGFYLNWMG